MFHMYNVKMPTTPFPTCIFGGTILQHNNQCIALCTMYIDYCVYLQLYSAIDTTFLVDMYDFCV